MQIPAGSTQFVELTKEHDRIAEQPPARLEEGQKRLEESQTQPWTEVEPPTREVGRTGGTVSRLPERTTKA